MEVDTITEHEAAIYDRQIRLWGVEAQRRMRSSVILFCGFGALNAEICKNLVLAGVSVAIQDSKIVQVEDLGGHLFLKEDSVGKNVSGAVGKSGVLVLRTFLYYRGQQRPCKKCRS
mmetsp:Transcript_36442/g.58644  ORF Transcript_36442/g.58644 Transcript_36442/m.58644 type:complete len:116 (+) Transcript_36442:2594-2941(+)